MVVRVQFLRLWNIVSKQEKSIEIIRPLRDRAIDHVARGLKFSF
jgi:hypothetical protein